jgi:hypothetical protein
MIRGGDSKLVTVGLLASGRRRHLERLGDGAVGELPEPVLRARQRWSGC